MALEASIADAYVTATNVTVSGNFAEFQGGGLAVKDGVDLGVYNSTITANRVNVEDNGLKGGGGVYLESAAHDDGVIIVDHSIIAQNQGLADITLRPNSDPPVLFDPEEESDLRISSFAAGSEVRYSWLGDGYGSKLYNEAEAIAGTGPFDKDQAQYVLGEQNHYGGGYGVGYVTKPSLDVGLDVLADNGGLTWTHALKAGSQVVNAGAFSIKPPTAYYRFNETSGSSASDSSGNARHAVYSGVTLMGSGQAGLAGNYAAQFDGVNDYVDLPDGFANFTNGITIEAWIYPTSVTSGARIVDLGNGSANNNIVFARKGTTNKLFVQVWNGATPGAIVETQFDAISLNQWQCFTATINSSGQVKIYKNGVELALTGSATAPPVNIARTQNFIGRSNTVADSYFAGRIDELAIYDRVLPPILIVAQNSLPSIPEDANVAAGIRVADLRVLYGANLPYNFALTGADASLFEVVGRELRLKTTALLDYESNPVLNVSITAADATAAPRKSVAISLSIPVLDRNDAPSLDVGAFAQIPLSRNASAADNVGVLASELLGNVVDQDAGL